jgi:hypothetical protein
MRPSASSGKESDPLVSKAAIIPLRPKYELVLTGDRERTPLVDEDAEERKREKYRCALAFLVIIVFIGLLSWIFYAIQNWRYRTGQITT